MLLHEGRAYHFVHRSFQEYFAAVFIKELDDKKIQKLANFFDNRYDRAKSDCTLTMLYDMKPEMVENFIFAPFLEELFEQCKADGYWSFLDQMYSGFYYSHSDVSDSFHAGMDNTPNSDMYDLIREKFCVDYHTSFDDLPPCDNFVDEAYIVVTTQEEGEIFMPESDYHTLPTEDGDLLLIDYPPEQVRGRLVGDEPETIGHSYFVQVDELYDNRETYAELLSALDDDGFILKAEYIAAQKYLADIKRRQKEADDDFDDLFN